MMLLLWVYACMLDDVDRCWWIFCVVIRRSLAGPTNGKYITRYTNTVPHLHSGAVGGRSRRTQRACAATASGHAHAH